MSERFFRRAVCLPAAAVLLLPLLTFAPLAEDGDTVVIRTVSGLTELAKNCTLDTWSQGKTVLLEADLDLSGVGFTSIPAFGGTFKGNGHTISGLSLTADGSHQGLFRYLQPSGKVTNLTVRGTVAPAAPQSRWASTKPRAALRDVSQSLMSPASCAPAVWQGKTPASSCPAPTVAASISHCRIKTLAWRGVDADSVLGELGSSRPGTAGANAADQQDTGGIGGYSSGVIQSCTNGGNVGYAYVGYNVGGAAGSLETALDRLRRSAGDLSDMGGSLQDAFRQLGDLSDDAGKTAAGLSVPLDKIKDAVDYLRQTGPITLAPTDDAYRAAGDRLFHGLSGVSDAMNALNESAASASNTLLADFRAINAQFSVLMDLVVDALADLQDGVENDVSHRVQDTSEENAAAQTRGKVEQCSNSGLVEGDRNVGGISGSMMGFLSACQNYGDVASTGGGYVGGIAGRTAFTLEKSYAKCSLSGKSFVGGIAGCGGTVRDCAAICLISDAAECSGAVVGYADELENVARNYYIDTGLGGVDGIGYDGHAQNAQLDFLRALDDVPAEFTAFRLILRADGRVLQTIPFTFGQRLSSIELPPPPDKEVFFGVWPTPEDDVPRTDVILDVEYSPWLTVISSPQADGNRSLALADGHFTSQAVLSVPDSARSAPAGASLKAKVWDVTLSGTDLDGDAVVSLRLLCPDSGAVRAWRDGVWQVLDARANGSYLIVEMHGTAETFCVEPAPSVPAALLAAIAAAVLALLLLLALVRKLVKKRRSVKAAARASEKADEQKKEPVGKTETV